MEVTHSNASGGLYLVDGNTQTHDACGGVHTFNCSDEANCWCRWLSNWCSEDPTLGLFADLEATICYQDLPVETTPVDDGSLSSIKSLYWVWRLGARPPCAWGPGSFLCKRLWISRWNVAVRAGHNP